MLEKFLENGNVDAYEPMLRSLPELATSLSVDVLMWVVILFLLFFNKYTRTFTIASALLFIIF